MWKNKIIYIDINSKIILNNFIIYYIILNIKLLILLKKKRKKRVGSGVLECALKQTGTVDVHRAAKAP